MSDKVITVSHWPTTAKGSPFDEPIVIKYKNDDNFKSYFIRQLGVQVEYDTDGSVIVSDKLNETLFGTLSGLLNFITDNISLPNNPTVIDIGAGNSLIDLALSMYLKSGKFILVDGNALDFNPETIHSKDFKTYNSWQMVHDAIELSKLNPTDFIIQDIDYDFSEPADLIISSYSWGMHYPVDVYLDKVVNALKPGGYLILHPVLNINGYMDEVDKRLTRIITEPEGHWMRDSKDWHLWEPHFRNLPKSEPTAYRCIWQKS